MLAIAAAYYAMSTAIPRSDLADAVGPGALPRAYALGLAALAILLMGRRLVPHDGAAGAVRSGPPAASVAASAAREGGLHVLRSVRVPWRAAVMLGIGASYVALAERLGYPIALAGLMFATICCQSAMGPSRGSLSTGRMVRAAIIAVAGAVVFWIVFTFLLRVPQPAAGFRP
jgi:hypothetical protein